MERNFKGIWIPKEIWLNKKLTVMEKLFLVEIDSLDNEDGCFASNKYFAEFFGISKGRCTQILKQLEQKKCISIVVERDGKIIVKRVVKILNRVVRKLNNPSEKTKQPYLENDEDNNTLINNTNIQKACASDLKLLANNVGNYFGKTSEEQQMKVYGFLKNVASVSEFQNQFEAYKKYKSISKEKIHRFESFAAEWNQQDWNVLLKNASKNNETPVISIGRKQKIS